MGAKMWMKLVAFDAILCLVIPHLSSLPPCFNEKLTTVTTLLLRLFLRVFELFGFSASWRYVEVENHLTTGLLAFVLFNTHGLFSYELGFCLGCTLLEFLVGIRTINLVKAAAVASADIAVSTTHDVHQLCYEIGEEFQKCFVWHYPAKAQNTTKYKTMINEYKSFGNILNQPETWEKLRKARHDQCHLKDMEAIYCKYLELMDKGVVDRHGHLNHRPDVIFPPAGRDRINSLLEGIPEFFQRVFTEPRLVMLACQLVTCLNGKSLERRPKLEDTHPFLQGVTGTQELGDWANTMKMLNEELKGDLRCPTPGPKLESVMDAYRRGRKSGAYQAFIDSLPDPTLPFSRDAHSFGQTFEAMEPASFTVPTNRHRYQPPCKRPPRLPANLRLKVVYLCIALLELALKYREPPSDFEGDRIP